MICRTLRFVCLHLAGAAVLICLSLFIGQIAAQQKSSKETAQKSAASAAPLSVQPPDKETVNAFLDATWGYMGTRSWQVQTIEKTPAEGVSKVTILVTDKGEKEQSEQLVFYTLPDGKHIIVAGSGELIDFSAHPFAEVRAILAERANGPYQGVAPKDLELVEFADLQCPLCKEKLTDMEKLAQDFPKARIVFQYYPIEQYHPAAFKAAAYGVCVNKQGGGAAFFTYATEVYAHQEELTTADGSTPILNNAVVKAGLDPARIAACAIASDVKEQIRASVQLAKDLNIGQSAGTIPTLVVNGRIITMKDVPYETLKQIVASQAKLDGAAN